MRRLEALKISWQSLLIVKLTILTYFRWEKLDQEETSLSYSTARHGLYLPSVTICLRAYEDYKNAPKMNENVTFQEFMETSKSVKDLLIRAIFKVNRPNDQDVHSYDFLNDNGDDFIDETYYLVSLENTYYGLNRCITINAPLSNPVFFKDALVRIRN